MNWYEDNHLDTEVLRGMTLVKVEGGEGDDVMDLYTEDGRHFQYYHSPDCCEHVRIIDVVGDINDLLGSPLTMAEESSSNDSQPDFESDPYDSFPWTFYKFATVNGCVTVRWLGESNGYYSEEVDLHEVTPNRA